MSENAAAPKELSGRIGKYEIVKPLGKGAMGMVYLAHDTVLERDVALKVMVASIADDPELKQRFEREAKAVAKMTHANVVAVFDLGSHTDGSPYIAMELLKGQDLQKAMRASDLGLERKVQIILQTLAGLAHAHQAGIVHRDIKPANIFISQDGTVKIMDFGVARLTSASMTGTGNIVGTADYMSPEQVKGARVDGRSDLFSVGCMLYELLTNRRPYHSDNLMAIFYKITHEEPNWDLIPAGPEYDAIMPILKKALAKDLAERYQSAYEFAQELKDYLRQYGASSSGQFRALEELLDLQPPPERPEPITEAPGATLVSAETGEVTPVDGTVDLGSASRAATLGRTGEPTLKGGSPTQRGAAQSAAAAVAPTVVRPGSGGMPATVVKGGAQAPTVVKKGGTQVTKAPVIAPPAPAPGPSSNTGIYVAVGGLAVALLALGGYVIFGQKQPAPPPATLAANPPVTAPPATAAPATLAATPEPPPPTTAPPPTFAEAQGKGAAAIRAAQAAFKKSDYGKAVEQAQAALREDPASADAKRLLDQAVKGQQAEGHFKAADAALKSGDFPRALSEAEAGREAAPWDARGPDIVQRIQQAQQQAAQQQAAQQAAQLASQVNGLLGQADAALAAQKYDDAIRLYDEVLKLDGNSQRANVGKTSAVGARAVAQAAGGGGGPRPGGKAFVSAKTVAQSGATRAGNMPEGFEETPGVTVKKGTAAAELPGKIVFEIDPEAVKAGERYTIKIFMVNEGSAPIALKEMIVGTKINGRGVMAPVPPQTKDVAPAQKALLLSMVDTWKEDISAWSLEVIVRTDRGEKYSNSVAWK